MTPSIEKEIDRILTLLRNKIRERGFTQLEVQERLDWGRSYVSQLLTKQKSARIEQVLMILDAIRVDPQEFYAELYQFPRPGVEARKRLRNVDDYAEPRAAGSNSVPPELLPEEEEAEPASETFLRNYRHLRATVRGLVQLLIEKDLVAPEEVLAAVRAADPELGSSE